MLALHIFHYWPVWFSPFYVDMCIDGNGILLCDFTSNITNHPSCVIERTSIIPQSIACCSPNSRSLRTENSCDENLPVIKLTLFIYRSTCGTLTSIVR